MHRVLHIFQAYSRNAYKYTYFVCINVIRLFHIYSLIIIVNYLKQTWKCIEVLLQHTVTIFS